MSIEQRMGALLSIKCGNNRIMVATNEIARSVDIPLVRLIINFETPMLMDHFDFKAYYYRVGRAARQCVRNAAVALTLTKPLFDFAAEMKNQFNLSVKLV